MSLRWGSKVNYMGEVVDGRFVVTSKTVTRYDRFEHVVKWAPVMLFFAGFLVGVVFRKYLNFDLRMLLNMLNSTTTAPAGQLF